MWPMGRELVVEVELFAPRMAKTSMRRENFELDGEGCATFLDYVTGLLNFICQAYNDEILEALNNPDQDHTVTELVSWTVSDLEQFLGMALQRLQQRLVDSITIDFSRSRPIRCAEALSGTQWFPEICREAAHTWREASKSQVSSPRFRRKRTQHVWRPRDVDLVRLVRTYFA